VSAPPIKAVTQKALTQLVDTGQAWISGLRLRAFFWVAAIALATWATIVLTSIAWVPVIGVAAVACVVSISKIAAKLSSPTCLACGTDLTGQVVSLYGCVCPSCGSLHMPRPQGQLFPPDPSDSADDGDAIAAADEPPDGDATPKA